MRGFEAGQVYLVDFWATWSPPCREAIPRLNALHQKFGAKGLVILGVNAGESESKVRLFLKQQGTNMTYRVALDEQQETVQAWSDPAKGALALPISYLINKTGKVLFAGPPLALTETVIEQTLDGTATLEKMTAYSKDIERGRSLSGLADQYEESLKNKEWDKASGFLDALEKAAQGNTQRMAVARFERLRLLINRGDAKGASEFAAKQAEGECKTNANLLNAMAWELATENGIAGRDLALAEKLSRQAGELTGRSHPQMLDTLARILFMSGKTNEALQTQSTAVSLAEGRVKETLQKNLDSYKKGALPDAQ